jgi:hypothetical protein
MVDLVGTTARDWHLSDLPSTRGGQITKCLEFQSHHICLHSAQTVHGYEQNLEGSGFSGFMSNYATFFFFIFQFGFTRAVSVTPVPSAHLISSHPFLLNIHDHCQLIPEELPLNKSRKII